MSDERISLDEAKEQVRLALRRLALYHAAMAETLIEELGPEEGRRVARAVVERYGRGIGRAALARTEEAGAPADAAHYAEDLPMLGFSAERISEEPWRVRIHRCPLATVWRELGLEELGAIYCGVDQAKYRAYNPDLVCTHAVNCLRDATDHCDLVVEGP